MRGWVGAKHRWAAAHGLRRAEATDLSVPLMRLWWDRWVTVKASHISLTARDDSVHN